MTITTTYHRLGLLRTALYVDAAVSGASAVAYLAGATVLDSVLGVSSTTLVGVGLFLLACAGGIAFVARRPGRTAALAVVAVNVVWVLESFAVAGFDLMDTTLTGTAWTVLQACTVGAFAVAEYAGVKREA